MNAVNVQQIANTIKPAFDAAMKLREQKVRAGERPYAAHRSAQWHIIQAGRDLQKQYDLKHGLEIYRAIEAKDRARGNRELEELALHREAIAEFVNDLITDMAARVSNGRKAPFTPDFLPLLSVPTDTEKRKEGEKLNFVHIYDEEILREEIRKIERHKWAVLAKNCLLDRIIREVEQDEWARVHLRGAFEEQQAKKALNAVITELTGIEYLRRNAEAARDRAHRVDPTSMNPYDAQLEAEAYEAEKTLERAEELVARLQKLWEVVEPLIKEFNAAKRATYKGHGSMPEKYELPTVKSRMEWREEQREARKRKVAEDLAASVAETEARFFGGAA